MTTETALLQNHAEFLELTAAADAAARSIDARLALVPLSEVIIPQAPRIIEDTESLVMVYEPFAAAPVALYVWGTGTVHYTCTARRRPTSAEELEAQAQAMADFQRATFPHLKAFIDLAHNLAKRDTLIRERRNAR